MDASAANTIKGRAPLRASGALRSALRRRGHSPGTLSYFYSAKNDSDIVLASDLALCSALDLEANERVRSYDSDKVRIAKTVEERRLGDAQPDVLVTCHDGSLRLRNVRYGGLLSVFCPGRAAAIGNVADSAALTEWFTEADVRDRERVIHDWLHIAPVLHATRWQLAACWASISRDVLEKVGDGPCSLGTLREANIDDWPVIFSAAWRLVQLGALRSDIEHLPLGATTTLAPGSARDAN